MPLTFHSNVRFPFKERPRMRQWIKAVAELYKKQCGEITYLFTHDEEVLQYNQQFLNHHTYTDIITFDNSEGNVIGGDIIISTERVKDNAARFGVAFEDELRRVMIHGILHLCGLKDKSTEDAKKMRRAENKALRLWDTQ